MSDSSTAILRLACIASAHARSLSSSAEAASLYDDIGEALASEYPHVADISRETASLLREGSRRKQLLSETLDSLVTGQRELGLEEGPDGKDGR